MSFKYYVPLLIVLLSVLNFAAVYDVSATNSSCFGASNRTFTTIDAALAFASAGDSIYVCGPTFYLSKSISINKAINLRGAENPITLVRERINSGFFSVDASGVNISHFVLKPISYFVYETTPSINISNGVSYVNISNNQFFHQPYAIKSFGTTSKILVSSNVMNNSAYEAIALDNSDSSVVIDNLIVNSTSSALMLNRSVNVNVSHNRIVEAGARLAALSITNINDSFFWNNTITNSSSSPFAVWSSASKNNTFTSNTLRNNYLYGFYLHNTSNSTFTSNTVVKHLYADFVFDSSIYNLVVSNIANESNTGYLVRSLVNPSLKLNNTFRSNIAANNTYGFYVQANSNNLTLNIAHNNTYYGFATSVVTDNIFDSNIAHNQNRDGFYIYGADNNTFVNNTATNNSDWGFFLWNAPNNTLRLNNATNNKHGFYIWASNYTTVDSNFAYNNTQDGFIFVSSNASLITSNTANSNGRYGIYISSSSGNTVSNNNATGNGVANFFTNPSYNNIWASNLAVGSQYGFAFENGSNNRLVKNTAIGNKHAQYQVYSAASVVFSEDNLASQTPANSLEVNVSSDSNASTSYNGVLNNFTTDHVTVFFGSLSGVGIKSQSTSSSSCVDSTSRNCTFASSGGLNISRHSDSASVDIGLFYNSSVANVSVGSSSSSAWTSANGSQSSGSSFVRFVGRPSDGLFAPVVFASVASNSAANNTANQSSTNSTANSSVSNTTTPTTTTQTSSTTSSSSSGGGGGTPVFSTTRTTEDTSANEEEETKTDVQVDKEENADLQEPEEVKVKDDETIISLADATTAIENANVALAEAQTTGIDVSLAQEKLREASVALAAGDYVAANRLAAEASALARGSAPIVGSANKPDAKDNPVVSASSSLIEIPKKLVLLVVITILVPVLVVSLGAGYFLMKHK